MCGRSSLSKTEKEIEERFNATFYSDELERYNPLPNFNVAPTHMHPVITSDNKEHLQLYRWGFIPSWAKDIKVGYKMINARKESIMDKSFYRSALKTRRCIVPFDGFYEWKKTQNGKQPYRIVTTNTDIFSVAGLWSSWDSTGGETIYSFTLITQEPNEMMKDIHNRMPAILLPEQEEIWLDENIRPEEALAQINPYPDELMHAYAVSTRVGNVRENDEDLLKEIKPPKTLFD